MSTSLVRRYDNLSSPLLVSLNFAVMYAMCNLHDVTWYFVLSSLSRMIDLTAYKGNER